MANAFMRTTMRTISLLLLVAGCLSAQRVLSSVTGLNTNEAHGRFIAAIGDVNGDGRSDFVTGSPNTASATGISSVGSVVLVSGWTGTILAVLTGPQNLAQLGSAVAAAGDANFDGIPDFAAGQPAYGPPSPIPAPNVSGLVIGSGANGTVIRTLPAPPGSSEFGCAVANAGDRSGDGIDDFIVGARSSAQVFLINGFSGAIMATATGAVGSYFGYSVATLGDLTGDGVGEFAVGAIFASSATTANAGSVSIHDGVSLALLRTHYGVFAQDYFGVSVCGLPDVNGDGVSDYAAGSPSADFNTAANVGVVAVYSGLSGQALWTRYGTQSYTSATVTDIGEGLGISLASAGDINQDGVADLLVGAFGWNAPGVEDCGRALVLSGNSGAELGAFLGTVAENGTGSGVAALGDLDFDGWLEVLIGTRGHDTSTLSNVGRVDAVAMGPFLGACANGGNSIAFLAVNGSTGGPAHRVDVPLTQPITVAVHNLSMSPLPAHFVLCAKVGLPMAWDVFPLVGVGTMCFAPALLAPGDPSLFILASSIPGVGELLSTPSASWSITLPPLGFAAQVALQPVIMYSLSNVFVANAVLVQSY
jgi:hypothetical protein